MERQNISCAKLEQRHLIETDHVPSRDIYKKVAGHTQKPENRPASPSPKSCSRRGQPRPSGKYNVNTDVQLRFK